MKTTRKILMTALALASAWCWQTPSFGAAPDSPAAGGQRLARFRQRMQNMAQELNLTDAQRQKLKPLWQERMQTMRELWQDHNLSPQEKLEKFEALREEVQPKLKEILTPEQLEKWQKQSDKMRGQAKERWQQRKQQ